VDLAENRYVGMKSRGVYETPGGPLGAQGASFLLNRDFVSGRLSMERS
jgi:argininosuccinate synthase